jgi:hypothetical protein
LLARIFRRRSLVVAVAGALLALLAVTPTAAQTSSYQPGELFVSVGGGLIRTYDSHGNQTGELDTQTNSSEIGGMCFTGGAMYSMNFTDQSISKFDGAGNLVLRLGSDGTIKQRYAPAGRELIRRRSLRA